jgi:hypothetical protein
MATRKITVREFENDLEGMLGGLALYRRGIDEFYLSHGFPAIYKQLESIRSDLDTLGMYEGCRDALTQAETLIRQGPQHDQEADTLMLNALRALSQASGSFDAMKKKLKQNPNATLEDFKPDPDGWAQQVANPLATKE